jgi:hypothetical protein
MPLFEGIGSETNILLTTFAANSLWAFDSNVFDQKYAPNPTIATGRTIARMRPTDGAGRGAPEFGWLGFAWSVIEKSSGYQHEKVMSRGSPRT